MAGKDNLAADFLSRAQVSLVHLGIDDLAMAAEQRADGHIQAFWSAETSEQVSVDCLKPAHMFADEPVGLAQTLRTPPHQCSAARCFCVLQMQDFNDCL